jgi:hypothetical protein
MPWRETQLGFHHAAYAVFDRHGGSVGHILSGWRCCVDLVERAGTLKGMLVDFALSDRFDREFTAVVARQFPGGLVTDEAMFTTTLDHFVLQHRLASGTTVVQEFVADHPELPATERDMLLGWQDVVEGLFEVTGKDRDAVLLFNFLDELTYGARSNLGRRALKPLRKGMLVIGRLVPADGHWLVSGHLSCYPSSARDQILAIAAEQAMSNPEAVFRNPAKLAEARRVLAEQQVVFVGMFGSDLIVVPGDEVPGTVDAFYRRLRELAGAAAEQDGPGPADFLDDAPEILEAESVAIHFVEGEGLSFYPDYHLLEELFSNPALISRRRYRERLSDFLADPDGSPEPLRRLAARDPAVASTVFARLLKRKRGFSWAADGEELLRRSKPRYFDGTVLPRTVPLSSTLSDALQRSC